MAYEKRICILKQLKKGFSADGNTLSGVVYAERMGEELTVTLRIPGLSALKEGRYVLVLQIGGKKFCLPAEEPMKIGNAPAVKNGFAALLCFVRTEAEAVAFGVCGSERAEVSALLNCLTEADRKKPVPAPASHGAPAVPLPGKNPPGEETMSPFREQAAAYDDEAIAESDYYEPLHADEDGDHQVQGKRKKEEGDGDPAEDETSFLFTRGTLTYYKEVRDEIEAVLKNYPADTRLKWAFPQSEWARNEKTLIGIIYEEGIPRYLCVASEEPDPALKDNSVFVPSSPFTDGQGFYVVFQDADTGAYVKVEKD